MFVTRTLLRLRREQSALFAEASYTAVLVTGVHANSCVAFERKLENVSLLVVVPRLSSQVGFPPLGERWQDTQLAPTTTGGSWNDLFTSRTHAAESELRLADLFAEFPVAVLLRRD
jgi:(1->4)-alpha-D-glucan 1-alpha-D-glucosylmutase